MRTPAALLLVAASAPAVAGPSDIIDRPLVLDAGQWHAQLVTEARLTPDAIGTPFVIAPDVWIGLLPQLTIGVVHSDPSLDRIAAESSLCLRTDPLLCDHLYKGGGLDARWSLIASGDTGHFAIAAHGRLLLRDLEPIEPAVTLGAELRWTHGRFALGGDPFVQLGLYNTDRGNDAELWLPVVAAVQPTCHWVVEFHTGVNSRVSVLRDGWHVPIGLAVKASATSHLDVGGAFGFASLMGPQNTPKERTAFLTVGWRS